MLNFIIDVSFILKVCIYNRGFIFEEKYRWIVFFFKYRGYIIFLIFFFLKLVFVYYINIYILEDKSMNIRVGF